MEGKPNLNRFLEPEEKFSKPETHTPGSPERQAISIRNGSERPGEMNFGWGEMAKPFRNRYDAGQQLADRLLDYRGRDDLVVLGLPRGGIPVAFEVAQALQAPLDVLVVRKLGLPGHEELAMGAIASGGVRVLNPDVVDSLRVPRRVIDAVAASEQAELERRESFYRSERPGFDPAGRAVILVDDGLATGATMRAAITALRDRHPIEIIVAVPVAPASTCREIARLADRVVCLRQPNLFGAVGEWYEDFRPTTDAEVRRLLDEAARRFPAAVEEVRSK